MGIDVKKWAYRLGRNQADVADTVKLVRAVVEDFVRCEIADNPAKASAPTVSRPGLDEPPQRAEGVPEWSPGMWAYGKHWVLFDKANAEIARRVAEEKRDRDHAFADYKAMRKERDAALAEVERLKSLQLPEGWAVLALRQEDAKRIADLEACVAEQTAEIERLSRPVENYENACSCAKCQTTYLRLRKDRNAREAAEQRADKAEASLAELREFVKTRIVSCNSTIVHPIERTPRLTDADLDAALAAYRQNKEPAK